MAHNKLHHTFTLLGAILIGFSFLFDDNLFWVLLGVGICFIMIGAIVHAVRHHKRKYEEQYTIASNEPVYVTPIQPSYPTYQYQMPPNYTPHYPIPNQPFKSPYQNQNYGSTPYNAPAFNTPVGTPYNNQSSYNPYASYNSEQSNSNV